MKRFLYIKLSILAMIAIFSSCTTTKNVTVYDEVYQKDKPVQEVVVNNQQDDYSYSQPNRRTEPNPKFDREEVEGNTGDMPVESNYSNTETYTDEDGNTYITNNYYYDDYYDYKYSSRIKRFHRPNWGYGYYDDYYTNLYWYNRDPYYWGTSIYFGYNWMWPSSFYFRPSWYWDFSIGFGWSYPYSYSYCWDPFYAPYSYYYWGYPYHHHHHNWYNYDYPYYYSNSYDLGGSDYHYRGRAPLSSFSNQYAQHTNTDNTNMPVKKSELNYVSNPSFAEKYNSYVASNNLRENNKSINTGGSINNNNNPSVKNPDNAKPAINTSERNLKPSVIDNTKPAINTIERNNKPSVIDNNVSKGNQGINGRVSEPKYTNPVKKSSNVSPYKNSRNEFNQKYSKPSTPKYSKPKTYISPGYSQPKSEDYYSRPSKNYSIPQNNENRNIINKGTNNNSSPRIFKQERNYSSPTYKTPERQSPSYTPKNNSSPSYSPAPRNNSPSYNSSPSRNTSPSYNRSNNSSSSPSQSPSNSGGSIKRR